jgi:hypothetical protein
MQDCIGAGAVSLVLENLPDILFVANVHQARRAQSIIHQDVEEDFDRSYTFCSGDLGHPTARIVFDVLVVAGADLDVSSYHLWEDLPGSTPSLWVYHDRHRIQ